MQGPEAPVAADPRPLSGPVPHANRRTRLQDERIAGGNVQQRELPERVGSGRDDDNGVLRGAQPCQQLQVGGNRRQPAAAVEQKAGVGPYACRLALAVFLTDDQLMAGNKHHLLRYC